MPGEDRRVALLKALQEGTITLAGRDKDGSPFLHILVDRGADRDLLQAALDVGFSVHDRGANGETVVHRLSRRTEGSWRQDLELFRLAGASLNVADHRGRTPLMYAAMGPKDRGIIEYLAEWSDVTAQDEDGLTARDLLQANPHLKAPPDVWWARFHPRPWEWVGLAGLATFASTKVLRQALRHGADPFLRDAEGRTALMAAAQVHPEPKRVVGFLKRKGLGLEDRNGEGKTALLLAASLRGSRKAVEALLALGASARAVDHRGEGPLHALARTDREPLVVGPLVRRGADPNLRNADGDTPLDLNLDGRPDWGFLRALLANGARPHSAPGKDPPLIRALRLRAYVDEVKALVDAGADLGAVDGEGLTPLMTACRWALYPEVVELLVRGPSEPEARDHEGQGALDHARGNRHLAGAAVLSQLGR